MCSPGRRSNARGGSAASFSILDEGGEGHVSFCFTNGVDADGTSLGKKGAANGDNLDLEAMSAADDEESTFSSERMTAEDLVGDFSIFDFYSVMLSKKL